MIQAFSEGNSRRHRHLRLVVELDDELYLTALLLEENPLPGSSDYVVKDEESSRVTEGWRAQEDERRAGRGRPPRKRPFFWLFGINRTACAARPSAPCLSIFLMCPPPLRRPPRFLVHHDVVRRAAEMEFSSRRMAVW